MSTAAAASASAAAAGARSRINPVSSAKRTDAVDTNVSSVSTGALASGPAAADLVACESGRGGTKASAADPASSSKADMAIDRFIGDYRTGDCFDTYRGCSSCCSVSFVLCRCLPAYTNSGRILMPQSTRFQLPPLRCRLRHSIFSEATRR